MSQRPNIQAIKNRVAGAYTLKGPLETSYCSMTDSYILRSGLPFEGGGDGYEGVYGEQPDFEFYHHARTDIPALIAYVEELEKLCKDIRFSLVEHDHGCLYCGEDLSEVYDSNDNVTQEHARKCKGYRLKKICEGIK